MCRTFSPYIYWDHLIPGFTPWADLCRAYSPFLNRYPLGLPALSGVKLFIILPTIHAIISIAFRAISLKYLIKSKMPY